MKITPIEIKEHHFTKKLRGYDPREVESLKETAAEALTSAMRRITSLEEDLKRMQSKLTEHEERETVLKDTITTAQRMVDDLKNNARKEGELMVAEARHQADELARQAQKRVIDIQQEILQLRKQRKELSISLKAVIDYHTNLLTLDEQESVKKDEEADKLRFIKK
ncbi:MAG: DivIVA domain-containing protein [Thermodesulfobacteriota bacterium]